MNQIDLKLNTYVPVERAQIFSTINGARREFIFQFALNALRVVDKKDFLTLPSLLAPELKSPLKLTHKFVPYDDLTPIEKAARRLMMVVSSAKEGSHNIFTEEEIIALAFDAGCAFTVVEYSDSAELLPIKTILVERRPDGHIVVFEEGASEGVVLDRIPPTPQA